MRTRLLRPLLAIAGVLSSVAATAQTPTSFFFPDDTHLVIFTSGGTFVLSNEQGVSWQVDPAQSKVFESWRTKLVGKPETSVLVKDLLGKDRKKAMKKLGELHALPPSSGKISLKLSPADGQSEVALDLIQDPAGKEWSLASGSEEALKQIAAELGLPDRQQLIPSLRTAGDGGKPWTHLVRMLEVWPVSYLAVGHRGVLEVTRDEAPLTSPAPSTTNTATPATKPKPVASTDKDSGGVVAIVIGGICLLGIGAGAGFYVVKRKAASAQGGDKVVRINAEEFKLLQFFQGEANRRLTSSPEASDREASLQMILTRFRGYPDLEGQVRALRQSGDQLNEQVRVLTYYKNYSEQADAFLKKHERLQGDLAAMQARLTTLEAGSKSLEEEKRTLTRERDDLDRSLKAARAELASADELFAQQIAALDLLAADLAKLKERIEP